jgi:hypothetical protein
MEYRNRYWRKALLTGLLAGLGLLLLATAAGAAVSARLDREKIGIDESVNLTVTADGVMNTFKSLDTEPLKKDFRIVNQSTGSSIQIINGQTKSSKTWSLELEPKRVGRLTIPPLSIGGEKTAPLTLVVSDNPETNDGHAKLGEAFLEVVPEMSTPAYLQSQITITVRLFLKSGMHLSDASLEEPDLHARVIRLGNDARYQTRRQNATYQVIERKYAIIPEEGEEITIPPLRFQAVAGSGNFPHDPFFDRFTGRARRLKARSQELKITLLPIPKSYTGKTWLPAKKLTLREKGKKRGKETILKVGEPLTREIVVTALGVTAEQLPELELTAPKGGKIYADKAQRETRTNGSLLKAVLRQSVAFIPEQPGTFVLPEIRLKWWDLVNDREAVAVLPARTVKVVGQPAAAGNKAAPAAPPTVNKNTAAEKLPQTAASSGKKTEKDRPAAGQLRLWQGLCLAFALAWLLTLALYFRARRRPAPERSGKKAGRSASGRPVAGRDEIRQGCLANDPRKTQQALLDWAAATWPEDPPTNLSRLAAKLGGNESETLFTGLEKALYSPAGSPWEGESFWRKISPRLKHPAAGSDAAAAGKQADRLPPLYPE